jgi:hypothetical protein
MDLMISDFQDDVLGFSFKIGGFGWNISKHFTIANICYWNHALEVSFTCTK